jgi:hypothetical protein
VVCDAGRPATCAAFLQGIAPLSWSTNQQAARQVVICLSRIGTSAAWHSSARGLCA